MLFYIFYYSSIYIIYYILYNSSIKIYCLEYKIVGVMNSILFIYIVLYGGYIVFLLMYLFFS